MTNTLFNGLIDAKIVESCEGIAILSAVALRATRSGADE